MKKKAPKENTIYLLIKFHETIRFSYVLRSTWSLTCDGIGANFDIFAIETRGKKHLDNANKQKNHK